MVAIFSRISPYRVWCSTCIGTIHSARHTVDQNKAALPCRSPPPPRTAAVPPARAAAAAAGRARPGAVRGATAAATASPREPSDGISLLLLLLLLSSWLHVVSPLLTYWRREFKVRLSHAPPQVNLPSLFWQRTRNPALPRSRRFYEERARRPCWSTHDRKDQLSVRPLPFDLYREYVVAWR